MHASSRATGSPSSGWIGKRLLQVFFGATGLAMVLSALVWAGVIQVRPSPRGAVFTVELPEASFGVSLGGGAGWVVDVAPRPASSSLEVETHSEYGSEKRRRTFHFPTGVLRKDEVHHGPRRLSEEASPASSRGFDLDGDGHVDSVEPTGYNEHPIRVISGRDGTVLYDMSRESGWNPWSELIPLGDLDGDGYGEMALVYPRRDESRPHYDRGWFPPSSWLVVVSGAEL